MILVKDGKNRLREELSSEELEKFGSGQFLSHLEQKKGKAISEFAHSDPLMNASKAYVPTQPSQRRQEKGISIRVGGPAPAEE
jgi:hypothetical protein